MTSWSLGVRLVVGAQVRDGHHAIHGCVGAVLQHSELAWPLGVWLAPPRGECFCPFELGALVVEGEKLDAMVFTVCHSHAIRARIVCDTMTIVEFAISTTFPAKSSILPDSVAGKDINVGAAVTVGQIHELTRGGDGPPSRPVPCLRIRVESSSVCPQDLAFQRSF